MDAFSWGESHNMLSFSLNGPNGIKVEGLSPWSVPFVLSCICLFLQIIHILLHWINAFRKPGSVIETEPLTDHMASTSSHFLKKVKSYGGWTIYLFMVARLFGCLVLFALSVNSLLLKCQKNHPGVDSIFKHLFVGCPEGFLILTFVNPFPLFSFATILDVMIDSSSTAL